LREQQISHRHEEEEETKPNKKLAQTFLLQQQQQQQQQLVNKGTQQQTNNLKILQHPKIVLQNQKNLITQIFFFFKNHFLPRSCEMGLVDFTCQKTSQQQVNMMTIIIIFFFFFFFFFFDRSCTGNNLFTYFKHKFKKL
jgi:hypothetical protein